MAMARLRHTASTDILFPEPPQEPPPLYPEGCVYSPGANSNFSSYSHEVKYIFDPQYPRARQGYSDFANYENQLEKVQEHHAAGVENGEGGLPSEYIYSQPVASWAQKPSHSQGQGPSQALPQGHNQAHPNGPSQAHTQGLGQPHPQPSQGHPQGASQPHPQGASQPHPGGPGHTPVSAAAAAAACKYNYLASLKRRTWSPPTFERVMGAASSLQAMRSYRSNDQLDVDTTENHYEDLDSVTGAAGPPKIAPFSGMLAKSPHKSLIRPIAFKPIVTPHMRYVPTPQHHSPASSLHSQPLSPRQQPLSLSPRQQPLSPRQHATPQRHHSHDGHFSPAARHHSYDGHATPPHRQLSYDVAMRSAAVSHSQDDGYISQEYGQSGGSHSHSNSNTSQGSAHLDTSDRSISYMSHSDFHNQSQQSGRSDRSERPESYASSNLSRVSSHHGDPYMQTPSPSDSGVGELEAMLRDKDAEIQKLRETMEKNETAILQVYKERKENYEMEIREMNTEWERRHRFQQQKAFKTEQGLLMQLFKIQQERKSLRQSLDQARAEKENLQHRCSSVDAEIKTLKAKLEETQWEMCQKSGEISLLKQQLKEAKEEVTVKSTDLLGFKAQLRELSLYKETSQEEIESLKQDQEIAKLELEKAKLELEQAHKDVEKAESDHAKCRNNNNVGEPDRISSSQSGNDKMRSELKTLKDQLDKGKGEFETERQQWLDEKNKVIRYQKHLQLNYVQMYRKNRMLEAEVEQLTLELESRDIQLSSEGNMNEEESMC